jgi:hypothetical protein
VPEILPEIHLTIPPTIILLPSMKTVTKKRGRKPKPYIASWGDVFPGLRRRPSDGRWEANGKVFSEADERKAVQRFREMTGPGESRLERSEKFRIAQLTNWNWIADQIRSRPSWVAMQTGIEQIGYLTDIKPPKPLPSLDVLEQEWKNHARCSKDQKAKVLRAWQDFRETSDIGGLRDITAEICVEFKDNVHQREISGKQQQHIFCGARRLLRFCKSRAIAVEAIERALGYSKRPAGFVLP